MHSISHILEHHLADSQYSLRRYFLYIDEFQYLSVIEIFFLDFSSISPISL